MNTQTELFGRLISPARLCGVVLLEAGTLQAQTDYPKRSPFAAAFTPQWSPPKQGFSDWHYMVLSPSSKDGYFHYERPVIILQNRRCFSATDIFVGAFKGWRNMTLMGTATGGGSGRAEEYTLKRSGLRARLSTMASFQPSGRLYDANGIEPDIVAQSTLDDLLGKTDSIRDKARVWIKSR